MVVNVNMANTLERLFDKSIQTLHVKIDILDINDNKVDTLDGVFLNGNITISNNDIVRRTINMDFFTTNKTKIKEGSCLWIDRRIQPYIGIEHSSKKIEWFNLGIYVISNPTETESANGFTVSIQGYDKMYNYHNNFMYTTRIDANTPIHEAIRLIGELNGETKFKITQNEYVIPYDRELTSETEMLDELKGICELYMYFQVYYDLDGYLVYEPTNTRSDDTIYWTFDNKDKKNEISRNVIYDFDSIKNWIKVIGEMDDETGSQPSYELKIEDNSKFSVQKIGRRWKSYEMSDYTTVEQCKQKCEYEMEQAQRLSNSFSIECSPIYLLNDVNKLIKIIHDGIEYICIIDEISMPIGLGSMNITAHITDR